MISNLKSPGFYGFKSQIYYSLIAWFFLNLICFYSFGAPENVLALFSSDSATHRYGFSSLDRLEERYFNKISPNEGFFDQEARSQFFADKEVEITIRAQSLKDHLDFAAVFRGSVIPRKTTSRDIEAHYRGAALITLEFGLSEFAITEQFKLVAHHLASRGNSAVFGNNLAFHVVYFFHSHRHEMASGTTLSSFLALVEFLGGGNHFRYYGGEIEQVFPQDYEVQTYRWFRGLKSFQHIFSEPIMLMFALELFKGSFDSAEFGKLSSAKFIRNSEGNRGMLEPVMRAFLYNLSRAANLSHGRGEYLRALAPENHFVRENWEAILKAEGNARYFNHDWYANPYDEFQALRDLVVQVGRLKNKEKRGLSKGPRFCLSFL